MTAGAVALAVPVGGLLWGVAEARAYAVRHAKAAPAGTPKAPVRVLHISDVHLVPSQRAKRHWVRSLESLEPDLVVVTGDLLAHRDAVKPVLDALGGLLHRPGVFVLGSNDYYEPRPLNPLKYFGGPSELKGAPTVLPTASLVEGLTEHGWLDLTNTRGKLTVAGQTITFVGVDDPHLDRDEMPAPRSERGDIHVGVTHAPYTRVLNAFHAEGADVIFAGHTHGGQVCAPVFGALVTNCDLDRGRAKGLHGWPGRRPDAAQPDGSSWLHVSAGVGTSPYARVRFACRPEATLLTLEGPAAPGT